MTHDDLSDRIGPFRILQVLGEGGMGTVYEAEQTEPVRRRVALKVLKAGMDSKEIIARFEAERQALAVMEHRGIAKVLAAGTTPRGLPYFAMELVKGVPLTEYCDLRKLSLNARLELFVQVCHAVHHAHQKGIIHRDLKPSNVLVAEQDGTAAPKIIDFGIAKALSQRLTDKTLVTAYGIAMGTPAYMSPEQAEMSNLDVDTRSDIYSLGVMLYELLVGELPVDPQQMGMPAFIADLVYRETDPERPSRRVTAGVQRNRIAALRDTNPEHLRKLLKGDLDWIVIKAMEKDRTRRYETVKDLATDIERSLRNEPVSARPPTAAYRLRKFVRRNRAGAIAVVAVALALVTGTVLASVGLVRARAAGELAAQEAATAQEVSAFLTSLFSQSDPSATGGRQVSARDLLDRGAVRVRTDLGDRPALQAQLLRTIGQAYRQLGALDVADTLLGRSLALLNEQGADPLELARAKVAWLSVLIDRGETGRAQQLGREALATLREVHGPGWNTEVASAVSALTFAFLRSGENLEEGEALLREMLALRPTNLEDPLVANLMDHLCWSLLQKGDRDGAADQCMKTLALRQRILPGDNFATAVSLNRAGGAAQGQGRFPEARDHYTEGLAMITRMYGPVHPEAAFDHLALATVFRRLREPDSSLVHATAAAAIRRQLLSDDNPQLAEALFVLAGTLRERGDVVASARAFGEYVEVEERATSRSRGNPAAVSVARIRLHARYAALLQRAGRSADARREEAIASREIDSAMTAGLFGAELSALQRNSACWWGTLAGHAARLLPVCDAAVAASDEATRPRVRDSRGVARAIVGDYAGAIEDFRAYIARPANVAGVPQREAWVVQLQAGRNPFTRDELSRMLLEF